MKYTDALKFIALTLVIVFSMPICSDAYVIGTTSNGSVIKWSGTSTNYYINPTYGPSGASAAVQAAMSTWNSAGSNFRFIYQYDTSYYDATNDGWNIALWAFLPSGYEDTHAINLVWYNTSSGQISDSDIIFNLGYAWATDGTPTALDVQALATHELGHSLNLKDLYGASDSEKTMYGYGAPGDLRPRTLDPDDIAGIKAIYGAEDTGSTDTGVSAFVTRFYQQCLNREPDAGGLANWVNALTSGRLVGADVAYEFIFSQEFINRNVSNSAFVIIMYRAFFDREPDSGGYSLWLGQLNSGESRESVLNGFTHSDEFFFLCARYGIIPY